VGRSVLLLLNQLPFDPTSGAARNVRSQCEVLASAGFEVHALATTATESATALDAREVMRAEGIEPIVERDAALGADVMRFTHRAVRYTVLDVRISDPQAWEPRMGRAFDELLRRELESFVPEILLSYGGYPAEVRRRVAARRRGATVVFSLQNLSYLDRRAFAAVDAVASASQFTTNLYRAKIGLDSTPVIAPFDPEDVVATGGAHKCLTYVNPSRNKGVMFFATLAQELSRARPDLPILIVEARGTGKDLIEAARAGGIDLAHLRNIAVTSAVPRPRMFLGATRVLAVPSVWAEPFGRVAAEALLNGIPPIVSDRGGLPEAAAGGGFVLPLPDDLTPSTPKPVSPDAVRRWRDLIIHLMTDDAEYARASARARSAADRFHPDRLRAEILTFFARVCRLPGDGGPFSHS